MEQGISLYEITGAYKNIEDLLEKGSEELAVYLDSIEMQMENKVNNIVRYSKNLELTALAINTEIARMTDLKKGYEKKSEALIDYISNTMQRNGIEKIDTEVCKLSFRKSSTVEIDDTTKIPKEYVVEKVSYSPDKKAIKEAIEKGVTVDGAHIENHKNLQIK